MPVPSVMHTITDEPRPAPWRYSAHAAAFASLSTISGMVDPPGEPRLERLGPPGQVRGEPDHRLIVIHPARRTDAHRFDSVPLTQLLDGAEDRVFDSLRAV